MIIIGDNTPGTPSGEPKPSNIGHKPTTKAGGISEIAAKWQKKWNNQSNGGDATNIVSEGIESIPYEESGEPNRVSQMMALVQTATAKAHNETEVNRVLFDRSDLIPNKSVIRFKAHNGNIMEYQYLRDSGAPDKKITKLPFLKLKNIEDGRVVIWNGVISPNKDIIYALFDGKGSYHSIDVPFNAVL